VSSSHDDLTGFGGLGNAYGHNGLGPEVTLSDSGMLSPMNSSTAHGGASGSFGRTPPPTAPAPNLIIGTGNFEIDLVWDSSVANAPTGFMAAVENAAQSLVNALNTAHPTIVYVAVGWGEIAGQNMASNALGESESNGYLTNYTTVASALTAANDHLTASNEPAASTQFFLTSAEAKALNLVSGTGGGVTSVDGYVGFSSLSGTGDTWNFAATGTGSTQYNLQAVADHELTEVMGRISMEGTVTYNGHKTYTPLDLFDFDPTTTNKLLLNNTGGYFSTDGVAHEGNFNNAHQYGGDIADWASAQSASQSGTGLAAGQEDPFNAFGRPGYDVVLSGDDLLVMQTLGY
jgi:hypothetical protein